MAENTALEPQKQEITQAENGERTREGVCFIPRSDIFEVGDQILVSVDMPGVDESSLDITLEKNVLTINGYVKPEEHPGDEPVLLEYEVGDYQRSFRLSDEIDRDKIEASIKDGVVHLTLPKAAVAKTRKISVKAG